MEYSVEKASEVLGATPGMLHSWLEGLSEEWIASVKNEVDWQPYDVVGHLISAEDAGWIPRARQILEAAGSETPVFAPFDRLSFFKASEGKDMRELLAEFDAKRSDSLNILRSWELTTDQLSLQGIHPDFGAVTLSQLLSTWVVHDLTHIRQIARSMARRYEESVGPWREYLSIL